VEAVDAVDRRTTATGAATFVEQKRKDLNQEEPGGAPVTLFRRHLRHSKHELNMAPRRRTPIDEPWLGTSLSVVFCVLLFFVWHFF
jgi:hypothetical protein